MAMAVGVIMVVGALAIGEAAIMAIGTIIPVDIGTAMATTTIGTIRAIMTGTVTVIMVTAITLMIDPASVQSSGRQAKTPRARMSRREVLLATTFNPAIVSVQGKRSRPALRRRSDPLHL